MQWQGGCLILCILFLPHQVSLAFGLHQIADEWIVAFSVLDGYLARKKKKLRLCLTGESQDALYEGENETYIEASVENSSSILYDKEIRNKPRTRRTKRNV